MLINILFKMKKYLLLFALINLLTSCKEEVDDVNMTATEIISLNKWQLDRYSSPSSGKTIAENQLNAGAVAIFSMYYVFGKDQFVIAYDKASNQLVSKGAWSFYENETKIKVELIGTTLDFDVAELKKGKMILKATTGNYLSGVGEEINLEFKEKL